jgi:hypothetical protein
MLWRGLLQQLARKRGKIVIEKEFSMNVYCFIGVTNSDGEVGTAQGWHCT